MGVNHMFRYFIYLSYNGKNYHGWQIQPNGISIQESLEKCLSILLKEKTSVIGAGRTDAGVHAKQMVAHFDSYKNDLSNTSLTKKLNSFLPKDISIKKIIPVSTKAHARFDAIARTYQYYISKEKDPFYHEYSFYHSKELNLKRMNEAANLLKNFSDFTSFSKLHTDAKTNICQINTAFWEEKDTYYVFTIQANRFLRDMVRSIVGTLVDVGKEKTDI